MADGSIKIDTKIDDKSLDREIKGFNVALKKGVKKAAKAAAISMAAVGAAIAGVVKGAKKFSEITDRIDKMSQQLGLSRQGFQELDFVLSQSGVTIDGMMTGFRMLGEAMTGATADGKKAFDTLGVSIRNTDGSLRSQEAVLYDTINAFQEMDDGVEKAALAQDLFSRNAQQLMPLLNAEAGSFDALRQKAQELGLVLSDDIIDKGVILTDAMDQLSRAGQAIFVELFAPIVPYLNSAIQATLEWIQSMGGIVGIMQKVRDAFIIAWDAIKIGALRMTQGIVIAGIAILKSLEISAAGIEFAYEMAAQGIATGLNIAFESIKLGAITAAKFVSDKIIGAVSKMLGAFAQVPIIGEKFKEAQTAVDGFGSQLDTLLQNSVDNSKIMIEQYKADHEAHKAAHKEKLTTTTESLKAELQNANDLYNGKVALIKEEAAENKKNRAEADALSNAEIEKLAEEARARLKIKQQLESIGAAQNQYYQALQKTQAQSVSGYIDEKQAIEQNVAALEAFIDTLFSMGISTETAAEEGGDLLNSLLKQLEDSKAKLAAMDTGEEIGENLALGIAGGIRDSFVSIFNGIKNVFKNIAQYAEKIIGTIGNIITGIANFDLTETYIRIVDTIAGLRDFFFTEMPLIPVYFNAVMEEVNAFVDEMVENLPALSTTLTNVIKSMAKTLKARGPDIIEGMIDIVTEMITAIVDAAPDFFEAVEEVVYALNDALINNIDTIAEVFFNLIVSALDFIQDVLPNISRAAHTLIMKIASAFMDNKDEIIQTIIDIITEAVNFSADIQEDTINLVLDIVQAIVTALLRNLGTLVNAFINVFIKSINALILWLSDPRNLYEVGVALMEGLADGIASAASNLWDIIVDIGNSVLGFFKDLFGIQSPSKVFKSYGGYMMEGLSNGLDDGTSQVLKTMDGVKSAMVKDMSNTQLNAIVGLTTNGGVSGIDSLNKSIEGGLNASVQASANISRQPIHISLNSRFDVDGRNLAQTVYEHLDEVAS